MRWDSGALTNRRRRRLCRRSGRLLAVGLIALTAPSILRAQDPSAPLFDVPVSSSEIAGLRERGGADAAEGAGERGEEADEIETDRDSFTPATTTAGRGRFIVESAYTFIDNRRVYDTHSFPETVLRYGVTEWLEARLHWNYEVGGAGNTVSGEAGDEDFVDKKIERESQIGYGIKLKITEQDQWIPESAFLAIGYTPTSGPPEPTSFVGTYVWGWTLPGRWKLDAAMRYSVDSIEGDGHNLWAPSAVLKVPLWERVAVHAEYFGIFTTHKEDNTNAQYFSPGAHYLVTDDLEIGFRLGWGLNDDAARFFVNTGVGWRF